jgi:hypothetical protein
MREMIEGAAEDVSAANVHDWVDDRHPATADRADLIYAAPTALTSEST